MLFEYVSKQYVFPKSKTELKKISLMEKINTQASEIFHQQFSFFFLEYKNCICVCEEDRCLSQLYFQ